MKNVEVGYFIEYGGEGGIRTHGDLRHNGFRDRPDQPLQHLSAHRKAKIGRQVCIYRLPTTTMVADEGIEPPTPALGRRRSIH